MARRLDTLQGATRRRADPTQATQSCRRPVTFRKGRGGANPRAKRRRRRSVQAGNRHSWDGAVVHCAAKLPHVVVTVAANASVPVALTVPLPGATATDRTLSGPTVTVAVAVLVGSAWLTATT